MNAIPFATAPNDRHGFNFTLMARTIYALPLNFFSKRLHFKNECRCLN